MSQMGKHSTPLDGVTVANGHRLTPLVIHPSLEVRQRGPVARWPQQSRWRHAQRVMSAHRAWLAAVPVILVNAVAFGAQLGFWRAHVPLVAEAVLVALALESIAVYLAWQAHLAQLADDAALRLRLSAYGMALLIGALNYSHFMLPGWRPTVEAVTFGMMSAISPWLWSVHSRRVSRDALKAKGLIEPHAVRLGGTRWQWHPVRSVRVMSHATWIGETDPAAAIAVWQPRKSPAQVTVTAASQVTPEVTPEPPVQVTPDPPASSQPAPASQARPRRKAQVKPSRISDADLKGEIRSALAAGTPPSVNAVAKELGRGRDRVRPLLEQVRAEADPQARSES